MIQWLRRKFEADAKGEAVFPLLVLSALFFFDEFDTAAFATLAPEIQKSFELTDNEFIQLIIINVSVTALLAVPLGYFADRISRKKLVVLSGVLAGAFSLLTGFAVGVAALAIARFGNGVGLLANGPIHQSLLADYYTPDARPTVYARHRNSHYAAAVLGPAVAGILGSLFGWRAAFFVLFVPILIATFVATKLTEPARGATDPGGGYISETARPPKFREATRTLWRIRTLRRSYISAIFFGAGIIPLLAYLALFFEREYGLSAFERGLLGAASAACTYVGVQQGGKATAKWFAKSMGLPMQRVGFVLGSVGVVLAVMAAVPFLAVSIALTLVANYVLGYFFAPYAAVQALVSPARERSLAFSLGAIFLVFGVIIFSLLGLGTIADEHGLRWAIFALAPWWVVGGLVGMSAGQFVEGDVQKAMVASHAAAEAARAGYEATQLAIGPTDEDAAGVLSEIPDQKRVAPKTPVRAKPTATKPAPKRAPVKRKAVTPQALGKKTAASAKSAATRPLAKKNGAGR